MKITLDGLYLVQSGMLGSLDLLQLLDFLNSVLCMSATTVLSSFYSILHDISMAYLTFFFSYKKTIGAYLYFDFVKCNFLNCVSAVIFFGITCCFAGTMFFMTTLSLTKISLGTLCLFTSNILWNTKSMSKLVLWLVCKCKHVLMNHYCNV